MVSAFVAAARPRRRRWQCCYNVLAIYHACCFRATKMSSGAPLRAPGWPEKSRRPRRRRASAHIGAVEGGIMKFNKLIADLSAAYWRPSDERARAVAREKSSRPMPSRPSTRSYAGARDNQAAGRRRRFVLRGGGVGCWRYYPLAARKSRHKLARGRASGGQRSRRHGSARAVISLPSISPINRLFGDAYSRHTMSASAWRARMSRSSPRNRLPWLMLIVMRGETLHEIRYINAIERGRRRDSSAPCASGAPTVSTRRFEE